tara:strand:+ start:539 stop:652 length:114 start_codon:yes stop_codon:yes gene_type:complete
VAQELNFWVDNLDQDLKEEGRIFIKIDMMIEGIEKNL